MSWIEVKLIKQTYARKGNTFTGRRIYHAYGDGSENAATATIADDGTTAIPEVGDTWAAAKASDISADEHDADPWTFVVTVDYTSSPNPSWTFPENPLSQPNKYSYTSESVTEPYFRDTDNKPVVNSAGEVYAQTPQRERSYGVITITRNVSSYDDATAESYRNLINSGSVSINGTTYAARKLRIKQYDASGPNEQNGVTYWTETIVIAKRPEGWDHVLEDRGLNELIDDELYPILDAKMDPVQLPWPLDGEGFACFNPTDTPAQRTYKPYTADNFPSGL